MFWKTLVFSLKKLNEFNKQKQTFSKITTITSKLLFASFKLAYSVAKCNKSHSTGESLVLPAAIDTVTTMLGESYAKDIRETPLVNSPAGRRIWDISEDLCDQLNDKL
jgi:hypothetical protein